MIAEIDIAGAMGRWLCGAVIIAIILIFISMAKNPEFREKLTSFLKKKK